MGFVIGSASPAQTPVQTPQPRPDQQSTNELPHLYHLCDRDRASGIFGAARENHTLLPTWTRGRSAAPLCPRSAENLVRPLLQSDGFYGVSCIQSDQKTCTAIDPVDLPKRSNKLFRTSWT